MKTPGLEPHELEMICSILRRHPEIQSATLFGSRAKGTHTACSDVDLALGGELGPFRAESMPAELDELPLPFRFEVQALDHVLYPPLREHIDRVGILIYPAA
jgi:predicted nucleotidyltransferase